MSEEEFLNDQQRPQLLLFLEFQLRSGCASGDGGQFQQIQYLRREHLEQVSHSCSMFSFYSCLDYMSVRNFDSAQESNFQTVCVIQRNKHDVIAPWSLDNQFFTLLNSG